MNDTDLLNWLESSGASTWRAERTDLHGKATGEYLHGVRLGAVRGCADTLRAAIEEAMVEHHQRLAARVPLTTP